MIQRLQADVYSEGGGVSKKIFKTRITIRTPSGILELETGLVEKDKIVFKLFHLLDVIFCT